jgi:hypothetical protein
VTEEILNLSDDYSIALITFFKKAFTKEIDICISDRIEAGINI